MSEDSLNTVESLENAFRLIGLSDLKIQETLKNTKLSKLLAQNVLQAGVLVSGCTKTQGKLLYILSTSGRLLGECGRDYICRGIMSNKFQTALQVETAIRYALDKNDVFDSDLLDKASGVGITINEKELHYEVHTYIKNNRKAIKGAMSKKVALVLSSLRQHPLLKWADQLMLKRYVENELSFEGSDDDEVGYTKKDASICFSEDKKKLYQQDATAIESIPNMFEEGFLARLHKPGGNKQLYPQLMEEHLKHTKGRVVTRFPPEPNGYLHIGHSKAIAINFGYAKYHGGYCYLRYDDTNPEAEEDIYVKSIKEIVEWLGFEPYAITFSSDYFDELYRLAVLLIEKGKAYICHCNDSEIKYGRGGENHGPRIACKHRDRPISENLKGFDDMKNGVYKVSEAVLRMKQDLEDGNPQMWDLVAYRILDFPHHRTGTKWRIYPTYDFTHCLVDSLENITHSLCTTEFIGSRRSYDWLCDALEVYRPQQSERRGVPPGAILSFVNELGVTTAVINIQVSRFENSVRKFLENITPRLMMILDPILIVIENLPFDYYEEVEIPYKMDDLTFGTHYVPFTARIYIDRSDFRVEDSLNYYRLAPGKLVGLLKVPFPIRAVSYTTDPVSGLVSEVRAVYETQNFEKPKTYIHWIAETVNGDSPIHIDQVRIFKQLFNSEKPTSHTNEDGFLANINRDSEHIVRSALIEKGFEELKQKQLKDHTDTFENLEFETLRFQAIRIGYFCMDKDSTPEKIVLNQIVSLKEDKGK
ncbi:glutamine-tRNA ligase [Pneumocystis jirovecii RU7]|uniref:glutamine--tRNA ligase n=1 Tax=Pneumocystis jirovecii (strain RU7) TaxID=1408657 RepID=A0A0W4ZRI9_PNEJ7|nr:glutamine-tRNA ligase [Pneumocystis jirovecii RU7]KTW30977.1 glutamine-tRNA ligase [Pneumocystis jirovecii RU7]